MISEFEKIQNNWNQNKEEIEFPVLNFDALKEKIKKKEKENFLFYYSTIMILFITLVVISSFFYFVAPVKEIISRIGVGLMLGGLLFRIVIEIISIYKAKRINTIESTLQAAENSLSFYKFRQLIHRVIAPIVVFLYTIGFFMISPEFSKYLGFWNVVFIDVFYVVIGIILFFVIRKGIQKEVQKLKDILKLKQEIVE
ncbi:hypothetical protein [Aureivirga marina]|uniref:hypothetical protein n=1 Tax=Aureivirga marina TaxID=1182451 RepID=UPI0018C8E039|nr:hypothetical protein [Aureivirga marina]